MSQIEVQHPLESIFEEHVNSINIIVARQLVPTRIMLAVLEVLDLAFLLLLVIALGVERGRQRGFLEGIEVALVLLILVNGACVNAVRVSRRMRLHSLGLPLSQMRRWALAKELRTLARDWSPLPMSSTNQGLLNNSLGEVEEARADRLRGKDEPSLRWGLRGTTVRPLNFDFKTSWH